MHILVVEDERRLAHLLRRVLLEERHTVDVATEGQEGLDRALSDTYDLIVLDLMLPGLDGLDVCRRLRLHDVATPVLMLTARGAVEDRVAGLNAGADDYLVKPFAMAAAELYRRRVARAADAADPAARRCRGAAARA